MKKKLLLLCGVLSIFTLIFLYIKDFDTEDNIVAIIDSGVDSKHPLLKGRVIKGVDFLGFDSNANDQEGHGTHIAGIIAEKTTKTKILPIRMLGHGKQKNYISMGFGIFYAVFKGADVVNMSYKSSNDLLSTIAIKYGKSKGVIFVGAAGNEGEKGSVYPASLKEVISIGAVNSDLTGLYTKTNYGTDVDYYAPGVFIESADVKKELDYKTGTSMSAGYVSGIISYIKEKNPTITEKEIIKILDDNSNIMKFGNHPKYKVVEYERFKSLYEGKPYFWISKMPVYVPLQTTKKEIELMYFSLNAEKIKIYNNEKLIKEVFPEKNQNYLKIPVEYGSNLIDLVAVGKKGQEKATAYILRDEKSPEVEVREEIHNGKEYLLIKAKDLTLSNAFVNDKSVLPTKVNRGEGGTLWNILLEKNQYEYPLKIKVTDILGNETKLKID